MGDCTRAGRGGGLAHVCRDHVRLGPFKAVGELMGCVQRRELDERAWPSKVYLAGKLQ